MKHITVKYFASVRETVGQSNETYSSDAETLGALRLELAARAESYAEALAPGKVLRMAMNQTMCDETTVLLNGAEVAFFPPVTGG
jgi:sulfur-carrier protein